MPTKKRKANIRTLNDLNGNSIGDNGRGSEGTSNFDKPIISNNQTNTNNTQSTRSTSNPFVFRVASIPTLPNADNAKTLIERVCREFEPIVKRRNYNVLSVSEMCCCCDGLDFNTNDSHSSNNSSSSNRGGRRKCRIMSNNVWGYNQTATTSRRGSSSSRRSNKSHAIHLRLRHPASHDRFLLYEDVAGTMAHELAHCEIGPHNDQFHKLMDEILEEHMLLMSQSIGTSKVGTIGGESGTSSFFPGQGKTLGKGSSSSNGGFMNPRNPGYTLGGDLSFIKWMSPREAACMAAEARSRQQKLRARGQHCCQPCTITIDDESDDENATTSSSSIRNVVVLDDDHDDDNGGVGNSQGNIVDSKDQKPAAKRRSSASTPTSSKNIVAKRPKATSRPALPTTETTARAVIDLTVDSDANYRNDFINAGWACKQCTFINSNMTALACSMCTLAKA